MALDVGRLAKALNTFIEGHEASFTRLGRRDSQLLELGALTVAAKHYELAGYTVEVQNLVSRQFKVKLGSRGHPWNFSWYEATAGSRVFEIHGNLAVKSAYGLDEGQYVVDVAVVRPGRVPRRKPRTQWNALDNQDLMTFIEAKAIVIYPMLVAQFVGIVHEIKPRFLGERLPWGFAAHRHFNPALVSLGYLHGLSKGIVGSFEDRRFHITVAGHFDTSIKQLSFGDTDSPLA